MVADLKITLTTLVIAAIIFPMITYAAAHGLLY